MGLGRYLVSCLWRITSSCRRQNCTHRTPPLVRGFPALMREGAGSGADTMTTVGLPGGFPHARYDGVEYQVDWLTAHGNQTLGLRSSNHNLTYQLEATLEVGAK